VLPAQKRAPGDPPPARDRRSPGRGVAWRTAALEVVGNRCGIRHDYPPAGSAPRTAVTGSWPVTWETCLPPYACIPAAPPGARPARAASLTARAPGVTVLPLRSGGGSRVTREW